MNRNHTKSDYINLVKRIKSKIRDMAFSSDFIVGYPGESDDDFNQTLDLIDNVRFASSYSFKYSPRPGTLSSLKHPNIVDDNTASSRLQKLQSLLNQQQNEFNSEFVGNIEEVLFTENGKLENQYVGRTKYLQPVHVVSKSNIIGKTLKVHLRDLTSFSFHGSIKS